MVKSQKSNCVTTDIDDFCSVFTEVKRLRKSLKNDEILCYRGASNVSNEPRPGVQWEDSVDEDVAYHSLLVEYPEEFDNKRDHLGTVAKMQHFGLPTRMLDVSGNILVGLYFAAASNREKEGYVEVFKVKRDEILNHNSDKALMLSCLPCFDKKTQQEIKAFCESHIGKIDESMIRNNDSMTRLLHEIRGEYPAFECAIIGEHLLNSYFVRANKCNIRMKAQDGYFIICGLDESRTNAFIDDHRVETLIIKKNAKVELLSDLKMMGIRDDTLYPDLERTALYQRSRKLGWSDLIK